MKTPSRYIQPAPLGLFDAQDRLEEIRKLGDPLAALDAVMDWNLFLPVLDRIPRAEPKGPGGRPAYPPLLLFKILVLQSSYGLSDEQAEFQIADRRSFGNFLGLTEADQVPDQNTIREFREKLTRADLFSELFNAFNKPNFTGLTTGIDSSSFGKLTATVDTLSVSEADSDGNVKVVGGAIEGSNVNVVEAMVSMIEVSRQFDMQMQMLKNAEQNGQAGQRLLSNT